MAKRLNVVTTFKDVPVSKRVRTDVEARGEQIGEEFSEITRLEITLTQDGLVFTAHGHVTGKGRDVGAQAEAPDMGTAADRALDKLERQLRTLHDKRIFSQRRDAQRHPPKKQKPA